MAGEVGSETLARSASWPETYSPRLVEEFDYPHLLEDFLKSLQEKTPFNETGKLAFFDAKTGLLNRRFFYMFAEKQQNSGESFGLVVMDIDLLKAYNTNFGEPQGGDMPIKAFSETLFESNKEVYPLGGSFVCRLDGDTFALLFNGESFSEGLP